MARPDPSPPGAILLHPPSTEPKALVPLILNKFPILFKMHLQRVVMTTGVDFQRRLMNESQRGALTSLPCIRTGGTYTGKHSEGSVNGVTCMCTCIFQTCSPADEERAMKLAGLCDFPNQSPP
jgi:hypothetical protein